MWQPGQNLLYHPGRAVPRRHDTRRLARLTAASGGGVVVEGADLEVRLRLPRRVAAGWIDPLDLRAKVVRRTRGFGTRSDFPICGQRGGVPRRGRPILPGSLAEQAARYGTARYAHDGGCAAIARPVFWKGKLAKVVVIAVPEGDSAVLGPQMVASDMPGRRRRPVAAGPW